MVLGYLKGKPGPPVVHITRTFAVIWNVEATAATAKLKPPVVNNKSFIYSFVR